MPSPPKPLSYRCVECGAPVGALLRKAGGTDVLVKCDQCGNVADPYIEHDDVHLCISVVLLRASAWRHVVFNSRNAYRVVLAAAAAALAVDVATTVLLGPLADGRYPFTTVHAVTPPAADPTSWEMVLAMVQPLPGLRVVNLVNNTQLHGGWDTLEPLPHALIGAAIETGLSLIATLWLVTALAPKARVPPQRSTVIAFCLSMMVRLGGAVFFVWEAPLYFLLLMDLTGMMWAFKGFGTLTGGHALARLFATVFAYSFTRVVARTLTGWSPILPYLSVIFEGHAFAGGTGHGGA
uniref:Protein ARV n=1 Tax=Neobodo designis TaxID=312471 RepID=A0A6U4SMH9_NEODS